MEIKASPRLPWPRPWRSRPARRPWPLRWAWLMPLVVQTVGIVGVVSYLSYRHGQGVVEQTAHELMSELGHRVQQDVDRYLAIPQVTTETTTALLRQGRLDGTDLAMLEPYFVQQLQIFPHLSVVGLANEAGEFLAVERPNTAFLIIRRLDAANPNRAFYRYQADLDGSNLMLQETRYNYDPHNDPPGQPWFQAAQQQATGSWQINVSLAQGQHQPRLFLAKSLPFTDSTGQFQGVVTSGMYLMQLGDFLQRLDTGSDGQILLMERSGLLVATSTGEIPFDSTASDNLAVNTAVERRRLAAVDSQDPLTAAIATYLTPARRDRLNQTQVQQLTVQGRRYFVQLTPIKPELDWLMVVALPVADFTAPMTTQFYRILGLSGLALLGAIAGEVWIARRLAQSLTQLTQATQRLAASQGETILPPTTLPIAEVQALHTALQQLAHDLHAAEQLRQTQAQAWAVQAAAQTTALAEAQRIAKVGSWALEVASGRLTWSAEKYRILGWDPAASLLPYPQILQNLPASTRELLQTSMDTAIATGQPYELEYSIQRPDGSSCTLLNRGEPILNAQGQVVKLVGTVTDISDRKRIEEALRQSEAHQRALIAALPDLLLRINRAGIYLECVAHPEFMRIGPLDPIGLHVRETLPPHQAQQRMAAVQTALATQTIQVYEHTLIFQGSPQIEEVRVVPYNEDEVLVVVRNITDRKQAELALHESELKFSNIFHSSPDPSWIATLATGSLINVNDRMVALLGYSRTEMIGLSYTDLNLWEKPYDSDYLSQVLRKYGKIESFEVRLRTKAGDMRTVLLSATVNRIHQQDCVIGSLKDISDRKQLELALQVSEEKLSDILNNATAAISRLLVYADQTWTIDYISNGCITLCGYTAAELIADKGLWTNLIVDSDWQTIAAQIYADIYAEQPGTYLYRLRHRDGTLRWIAQRNRSRWDADQGAWVVTIISSDISDRKQAEIALQASEERFRHLTENVPGMIFRLLTQPDGRSQFTYVGSNCTEIFGLEPTALLTDACTFWQQIHPEDIPQVQAQMAATIEHPGTAWDVVYRFTPAMGTSKWLRSKALPIRQEDGSIVWDGFVEDITERYLAAEQLRQSEATNRAILSAMPDLLLRINREGNCYDYIPPRSPEAGQFLPIQRHLREVLPPDLLAHQLRRIDQALNTGELQVWEHQLLKQGQLCDEEVRLVPCGPDECLVIVRDITARKQAEMALQASEERYRAIFDQVAVGINQADPQGQFISANQAFCEMLGYTKAELLQTTFVDLTHPDDTQSYAAQYHALLTGDRPYLFHEKRYRHRDGHYIWVQMTISVLRDRQGKILSDVAVVVNIDDRKQAEAALAAKTEELDRFFSVSLDLLCIADVNGYFRRLNRQWEKTLGYQLSDLEGARFLDFVHPDDVDITLQAVAQLKAQHHISDFINRYRCQDGSYRWIEWKSVLVGEVIYSAARDITERQYLEQELIKNRDFRELLFNESNDALFLVNVETQRTLDCNRRAVEMFDCDRMEELIDIEGHTLQKRPYTPAELVEITQALEQYGEWHCEIEYVSRKGRGFWGDLSAKIITFGGQSFTLVRIIDITDRKKVDQIKTEFISTVSHELRTPLTAIQGSLGLLKLGIYDQQPEQFKRMLAIASADTERLVRLVNDILDMERLESGQTALTFTLCQFDDLIAQAIATVEPLAIAAEVTVQCHTPPLQVWGAGDYLIQALVNLLGNAIKFSAAHSQITLTVTQTATAIQVAIADQGRGIPPEMIDAIFDRFQQVDASDSRQKSGSGLGLAICKQIIERHRGQIWATSTLGEGSTFYFTLPIVAKSE